MCVGQVSGKQQEAPPHKLTRSALVLHSSQVDLSKLGSQTVGPIEVEIIDSVVDYMALLKSIFDFDLIKKYLQAHKEDVKVLFDGLSGVTGPYGRAIFVEELQLGEQSIQGCTPSPDFAGGHPDPNLTYAHDLVERVEREKIAFGAASDGDGDRNMWAILHVLEGLDNV